MAEGTQAAKYKIGQKVSARVEKVLPFGVFVFLPDDTRAYIRKRELTLEGDVEPTQYTEPGQSLQAIVISLPEDGKLLELSVRKTLPDPWPEFARTRREGEVIPGVVKDLRPTGVTVQVLPGVDGFVPLEQIALWEVEHPEEVLWVGDNVEGVIVHLDPRGRRLRLSIRERMRRLAHAEGAAASDDARTAFLSGPGIPDRGSLLDYSAPEPLAPAMAERIGHILVVDDHGELRAPLVDWFRKLGCQADGAASGAEARKMLQDHSYSVVFMDLVLADDNGLDLIHWLQEQGQNPLVTIMSLAEWIEEQFRELQSLGVIEVFTKPLSLADLHRFLLRVAQGEPLEPVRLPGGAPPTEIRPFLQLVETIGSGARLREHFQAGLDWVMGASQAEKGLIFYLDPDSRKISIVSEAGLQPPDLRKKTEGTASLSLSLLNSPVRDVIEEGEHVLTKQASAERTGRLAKLLELLPFESCIGAPIRAEGEVRHALFLFHRDVDAFSRFRLRDAAAAAALLGIALERETLAQHAQSLGKFWIIGQLAAAIGHEIYNRLSGLGIQLRNLMAEYDEASQHHDERVMPAPRDLGEKLKELLGTTIGIEQTVELFRNLSQVDREALLNINQVVRQAQGALQPLARQHKVRLQVDLAPGLPLVRGGGAGLQQVFLNIMLNAVQQIALKAYGQGLLEISTAVREDPDRRPWVQVRFTDSGPGIHTRLQERIFAPGFSTRRGGTGLGLFIARSMIESMGGRILVERSIVPLGTTFLVELLAMARQEGNNG